MQNAQEINQMSEGQKSQTARTASRGLEPRCVPAAFHQLPSGDHPIPVKPRRQKSGRPRSRTDSNSSNESLSTSSNEMIKEIAR
ncbi:unnamed protein product [Oikopleura dioica]|uniref:Uncharacterized protein n=1 Tax=Oikopleura dioica TaxID=34765 RepID=E4XGP6_OIKDI|nr:unnamed protein product [Oikopleura dioica]